jgi:aminopeptidase N
MKEGVSGQAVHRKDYTAYPWLIDHLDLHFSIRQSHTTVTAEMRFRPNPKALASREVVLSGVNLELVSVAIDGQALDAERYSVSGEEMVIREVPKAFTLSSEVRIHPHSNTALEGLYLSGRFLLTQCEAEGFRKITWFPDRPDVMTRYTVTIEADAGDYPVLLSNGNAVETGDAGNGRHWIRWDDPFPKPSYLFALVAGDLAHIEDRYVTRSGRAVTLRVYVEKENIDRCDHAMESLIKAMRWDEERFGLEYDLDIYNIVATNDFNMGAMENKSLNIFNSKYVLARPDTATDFDYQAIEGVIGHEYFHNWTGNRVTCRDWFQLTLKEGLTVFRDEEFSADMQSRAVKRIQDVRDLRDRQFPEDAGPMAHPIRPDKYIEINNFYTATVYQKGATVIRLFHTLLGEEGFQKGMRLYFERHDGQAVTCDDFRAAMADANGVELDRLGRWYSQSGTPEVGVETRYDAATRRYTVELSQNTPPTHDQPEKQALVIPFAVGLLDRDGRSLPLRLEGSEAPPVETCLLKLENEQASYTFVDVPCDPVPSLLRDFSAPVKVRYRYTPAELTTLIANDTDTFARWEAAQRLSQDCILEQVARAAAGEAMQLAGELVGAFRGLLEDREADPALLAEAMALPAEEYLGYDELNDGAGYDKAPPAIARRSLKNVCLAYLAEAPGGADIAEAQRQSSDNMTDTLSAIRSLVLTDAPGADAALADFEARWMDDALVMDKWFVMQAAKPGHDTLQRVEKLMEHPAFSIRNPNKVRSLIGVFSMLNPTGFHAPDGSGYRFHADRVIDLNAINPQIAARMVSAFNRWKRYDARRMGLMKAELERIAAIRELSPDVFEIVSSALK